MTSMIAKQLLLALAMHVGSLAAKSLERYLSQKIKTWTIL